MLERTQIEPRDKSLHIDVKNLEEDLKKRIQGEVRFDNGSRALYATDSSNYRQVPIGVVIPKSTEDVIATVELCRKYNAPILSRGGGTSLAGQCCNVAVVMDMSKYLNNVIKIDKDKRLVTVEPGIVLDKMRRAVDPFGLTFGPDPATHTHCTLGGMLGNNSCGVHSEMGQFMGEGGRTSDNLEEMEILTYDGFRMKVGKTTEEELEAFIKEGGRKGEIYSKLKALRDKYADEIRKKFPKIPRRVSGYNLDELLPEKKFNVARALVGTESTCITILNATLQLLPLLKERTLLVLGYPDIFSAGHHVTDIIKYEPIGLEGIDDLLVDYMKNRKLHVDDLPLLPQGKAWLLVEFGAETRAEVEKKAHAFIDMLNKKENPPEIKFYDHPHEESRIWEIRESGLGATAFVPGLPDAWEGWEDSAVDPKYVGEYLRDLRNLFTKFGYKAALYGHFGQGCIHCRINFDLYSEEGLKTYRKFLDEAADLVIRYGGSISGEHGDGQSKADLLPKMFGPEIIKAFKAFKAIWDPTNKMNPGKVVNPFPILSNLRLGTNYNPVHPETKFHYVDDQGTFSRAALRCVGVGECRRETGGTMCPSYMVTKEEKHSTRGRAHLLFEMLEGDVIKDGWKSEEVKDALDLCLACKGCKGDCPVKVDMATYKAEFLSHYYMGKIKPIHAYIFGLISRWSRLASLMPRFTNFIMRAPFIGTLMKSIIGVAQQRTMPEYATFTFKDWFKKREIINEGKPMVMLWPDSFNNYFHPDTSIAAVEVLEHFGFQVIIPRMHLCCGRPLYDYGMLDTAKKWLREILVNLRKEIREGIPVVGLEPSCTAVFRDELLALYPYDEDAKRLSKQTFLLSEFIAKYVNDKDIPKLKRKALVHGHCHHKSLMRMTDESSLLKKMEMDFHIIDSGCCGMAGAFGFEKEHYEVSIKCGERILLPEVRNSQADTLVIANGFSCREQIAQTTDKSALHLSEILLMAIEGNEAGNEEGRFIKRELAIGNRPGIKNPGRDRRTVKKNIKKDL
jgi:FAD/FMN-containing dehydrogenase/Fe-S oxidoreductase